MLYSTSEKIKNILSYFNILSIKSSFYSLGYSMSVRNVVSNTDAILYSYYPMYNILTLSSPHTKYPEDSQIFKSDSKYDEAIQYYYNLDKNYGTYKNDENFLRFKNYKTKHYNKKYFGLYDNLTNEEDLKSIISFYGLNFDVNFKFGDFIIDNNNNLRIQQYPSFIIDENVTKCFFGEFQIYNINNFEYKLQYVIYEKSGDVILHYHNSFLNRLIGSSDVWVNLQSVFSDQTTILDDLNDITKFNNEYFIVYNFLNLAIFRNTSNGIYRYIVNIFNKDFFKIFNDNVGYNLYNQSSIDIDNVMSFTFGIDSDKLNLKYFFLEQNILKELDVFKNIPKIVSNAEDYNDAIFSLSSTVTPILFVVR